MTVIASTFDEQTTQRNVNYGYTLCSIFGWGGAEPTMQVVQYTRRGGNRHYSSPGWERLVADIPLSQVMAALVDSPMFDDVVFKAFVDALVARRIKQAATAIEQAS